MKLYHGTSEWAMREALKNGLQPRRALGSIDNWKHTVSSNPDAIYLTDTYACHFAIHAMSNHPRLPNENGGITKCIAVIEIETHNLVQNKLRPDEDALEQIGRGLDAVPGDMKDRTMYYREKAKKLNTWLISLKTLGTCGYYGQIHPRHFSRVALFEPKKNRDMQIMMMDSSVSVMSFRICGHFHKNYMRWLFGEQVKPSDITFAIPGDEKRREWLEKILSNRDGIEIINLKEERVA